MRFKNLVFFFIVLAVLLAVVFIKRITRPKVPTAEQWADIVPQSVNNDNITDCLISLGEKQVHLLKKDNNWFIDDKQKVYADKVKINFLLGQIDSLQGELRSDEGSILADYGISNKQGVHIQLKNKAKEICHIVIGTKKAGWKKNFVRLNSSNAVYIADGDMLSALGLYGDIESENLKPDQWLDKQILHFAQDKIKSVKLEKGKDMFMNIEKAADDKNSEWKTIKDYSQKIDQSKITGFLKLLSELRAGSFASAEESKKFKSSSWKMSIGLDDGTAIILERGQQKSGNYYLKVSDKDYLFKIPEYTLNRIDQTDGDFFTNNPLDIKQKDIEQIMINDAENKKEISLFKQTADKDKENKTAGWVSDQGIVFKENEVNDFLKSIEKLRMHTISRKTKNAGKALIVRFKTKDSSLKITIEKDTDFDNWKQMHYLTVKGDPNVYFIDKNHMSALKTAVLGLVRQVAEDKKKNQDSVLPKAEDKAQSADKGK